MPTGNYKNSFVELLTQHQKLIKDNQELAQRINDLESLLLEIRNNPKIIDKRLYAQIPDTDYRKGLFLKDAPNSSSSASNGTGGWNNNTNPLYTTEDEFDAAIKAIKDEYGCVL